VSPKVSLVIPNYNYARPLEECLRAALAQTYESLEVIVVDDCSTDDSAAIAESYGVRVLRTPRNVGAPAARNVGAAGATGEIIFFVDSDVALHPNAVANAVAVLESDRDIGAVCGHYEPEPLFADGIVEEYRSLQQYFWIASDEGTITTSYTAIMAVRKELFESMGGFDPIMRDTDNAEFGSRLSRTHRIVLTSTVRGRHDYDDTLRTVLSKVFTRARLHIPLYLRRADLSGGFSSGPRAWASIVTLLALVTAALPVAFGTAWLAVPIAILAAALACDVALYRFVRRRKGSVFLVYFVGMHILLNLTVASAAVIGGGQWLLSRRFRRMYEDRSWSTPAGVA